jgi:hypothetical protein
MKKSTPPTPRKLTSEKIIPYLLELSHSEEDVFSMLKKNLHSDISDLLCNIIKSIPSTRNSLKVLVVNGLYISLQKNPYNILKKIMDNIELIVEDNSQILSIIITFYIESLSDSDITEIEDIMEDKPYNLQETLSLVYGGTNLSLDRVLSGKLSSKTKQGKTDTKIAKDIYIMCPVCEQNNASSKCGGCHNISYCSEVCQRADWPRHKKVCKLLTKG